MNQIFSFILSSLITIPLFSFGAGIRHFESNYDFTERPGSEGKIVIDRTAKGQTIDSSFYGSHLDSFSEFPSPLLVKELGLGMIRIGGNEYDVYNWKTGVSLTQHKFHTLKSLPQISQQLKLYKATGIFQINAHGFEPELKEGRYVLRDTFGAQSAYEMIKHLNGTLKLGIANVSIGNEFEQWHETHPHSGAWTTESGISADEYIERYIEFALAIRQAQEDATGNPNSIKIWGPEISSSWLDWNTGNFSKDCKWDETIRGQVLCSYGSGKHRHFIPYFLERIAKAEASRFLNPKKYKLLDYFAFHYYPNFRTKIDDINSIIQDPDGRQWVSKMLESTRIFHDSSYINEIDLSSYKKSSPAIFGRMNNWVRDHYPQAKIALNEFAIDSDYRSTNYHPVVRPLYLADTVGIATKSGISFFNNFVLSGGPDSTTPWPMISGDGQRTHQFYMYSLLSNHFLGQILNATDSFGDQLNSYASESADSINLLIVNKSPKDKTVQVYLKDPGQRKIATYTAPGWSSTVLKIDKSFINSFSSYDIYRFGADEMGTPKDLSYEKYR